MAHRRRKTGDPADRTVKLCISLGEATAEGIKAQAQALGITVSYLMDQVAQAYLKTRKRLTTD